MSSTKTAMIIMRDFPPVAVSGVHRVVGVCHHLVERGWRVTVISAVPSQNAELDEQLLEAVPQKVRVVRAAEPDLSMIMARLLKPHKFFKRRKMGDSASASAGTPSSGGSTRRSTPRRGLKLVVDWLSWWLLVPDGCAGWLLPAISAGLRAGRRERPDVIFSSAPVWTAHIVGMVLSRLLRVPFVADFRDPWYGSAFRNTPYRAHRYANRILQRMVVRRARLITCAWDGIRRHLELNYPAKTGYITTVLNGFDPEAIDAAPTVCLETQRKVFLHTGNFYGPRSPVPLLEAVRRLHGSGNESDGVLFVLAGHPFYGKHSLESMIRDYGVQDRVQVLPQLPHREALGLMKGADAALLFGQSGKKSLASVPGKAYEYIATGKPVLAIGAGAEACAVMRRGGCRIWTASAEEPPQILAAVQEMVQFIDHKQNGDASDPEARSQFTRQAMAARIERVLSDVVVKRTGRHPADRKEEHQDLTQAVAEK